MTGKKIRQYLDQPVTVFLDNGVAMKGILLDYFYDPVEKEGCVTLSNDKGGDPPLIFRRFITTIQPNPASTAPRTTKRTI
jgi:sRNA-binding regulator protein Hfq